MIAALIVGGDSFFTTVYTEHPVIPIGTYKHAVAFSIDPSGMFYVLDGESHELLKVSPTGIVVEHVGGYGWSELTFDRPADVSVANGLDVYVADYGNHRIQHFDRNLNFRSTLYLRDNEDAAQRFGYPSGVCMSRHGDLLVVDGENSRVLKLSNNRRVDKVFGGIDAGEGRLRHPSRIRVNDEDVVYVQDENVIKVFDLFGNYVETIGESIFHDLRSFTLEHDTLFILDSCHVVSMAGTSPSQVAPLLIDDNFDEGECKTVDLAIWNRTLYILTEKNVKSFPLDYSASR